MRWKFVNLSSNSMHVHVQVFFFSSFINICIAVGNPTIEGGGIGILFTGLTSDKAATFLCLSQVRTWISNTFVVL